jgi:hypothetical protein
MKNWVGKLEIFEIIGKLKQQQKLENKKSLTTSPFFLRQKIGKRKITDY